MWKVTVLVTVFMFSSGGDGLFHSIYKKARVSVPHEGDVGEPLFLTSYIEAGKLKEGKFHKIRKPLVYFQQVFFFKAVILQNSKYILGFFTQLFYFKY